MIAGGADVANVNKARAELKRSAWRKLSVAEPLAAEALKHAKAVEAGQAHAKDVEHAQAILARAGAALKMARQPANIDGSDAATEVGTKIGRSRRAPFQLIATSRTVHGHPSGTVRDTEEALKFAALMGIRAMTEAVPLSKVDAAYKRMMSGEANFRMVLTTGKH